MLKNYKEITGIKIKGKFNNAEVFTEVIEDKAIEQVQAMCDFEAFKGCSIKIMPDVHSGAGCTIGTTMTIKDKIVPNMVGVDIGCGMEVVQIKEKEIDFAKLDNIIKKYIPYGFGINKKMHKFNEQVNLEELKCKDFVNIKNAKLSLGSLGGGNHFIEVDKDEEGNNFIVIHSGSRHLGKEVAEFYQKKAIEQRKQAYSNFLNEQIEKLKKAGKEQEISAFVKKANSTLKNAIPDDMAWVEGDLFNNYIHDMKIVQKFAVLNRKAMINTILVGMRFTVVDEFTCIHNYIDTDNMSMRKGAVSARKGEKILIPINMRDGSLICIGKGNKKWNYSAPHGAGRLMSRKQAKQTLSLEEFKAQMQGIFSTTVSASTLDESPMAYKTMDDILKNITPTAKVEKIIKPIYNFKADE